MIALGLARALGVRGTIVLACVLVLVVTAYGVAQDLGLVDPPAQAAPARTPTRTPAPGCRPKPTRAAATDIPRSYLRLYCQAAAHSRVPWSVLAAVGKVESDHGRVRLPGVRSGSVDPPASIPHRRVRRRRPGRDRQRVRDCWCRPGRLPARGWLPS